MEGYQYIERLRGPGVVEFYAQTPRGHRVVTFFLDGPDPRILAFNESSGTRTPATIFKKELDRLLARARFLTSIMETDSDADEGNSCQE